MESYGAEMERKKRWICRAVLIALCVMWGAYAPDSLAASRGGKRLWKLTQKGRVSKKSPSRGSLDRYKLNEERYLVIAYVNRAKLIAVRKSASPKSRAIYGIQYGDAMVVNPNRIVRGKNTAWIPVYLHHMKNTGNRKYGKWKTAYIDVKDVQIAVLDRKKMVNPYNGYSAKAIRHGLKFLGSYHEDGGDGKGMNMNGGVCCSYFVRRCYRAAGRWMPEASTEKMLQNCRPIEQKNLKPGDLIFYYDGEELGHVSIYIGQGFMLSASGHYGKIYPNGGVTIKRVNYGERSLDKAAFGRL